MWNGRGGGQEAGILGSTEGEQLGNSTESRLYVFRLSGRRALGEIARGSEGCRGNRLLRGEWVSANALGKGTTQERD